MFCVAASVSSLRKMVATTTMDKVSVLDTRDKLLRLSEWRDGFGWYAQVAEQGHNALVCRSPHWPSG